MPADGGPAGSDAAGGSRRTDVARFGVAATAEGVRAALQKVGAFADDGTVPREDLDRLEIAMAEVLNNVVEHAYAGREDGWIHLHLELRDPGLHVAIRDDGAPMPAGRLPGGAAADPERDGHEQAEGGYGLHLIRQLSRKLRYARVDGENRLSFRLPLGRG